MRGRFSVGLLTALLAARAWPFWSAHRNGLYFAPLGLDDITISLDAWAWAAHPSFWGVFPWLPLSEWLFGLAGLWSDRPLAGPLAVNAVLSILAAVFAALLALELEPGGREAVLLSATLVGFAPETLLIASTAWELGIYHACLLGGAWTLARHLRRGGSGSLLASAAFMAAAGLTRYDGWIASGLFAALLAWDAWRAGAAAALWRSRAFAAALALAPAVAWVLHYGADAFAHLPWFRYPWLDRSAQRDTGDLLKGVLLSFPLAVLLLGSAWRQGLRDRTERVLALFAGGVFLSVFAAGALNGSILFCHGGHLAPGVLLFYPLGAIAAARRLGDRRRALGLLAALTALLGLLQLPTKMRAQGHISAPALAFARLLDAAERSGRLAGGRVLVSLPNTYKAYGEPGMRMFELILPTRRGGHWPVVDGPEERVVFHVAPAEATEFADGARDARARLVVVPSSHPFSAGEFVPAAFVRPLLMLVHREDTALRRFLAKNVQTRNLDPYHIRSISFEGLAEPPHVRVPSGWTRREKPPS